MKKVHATKLYFIQTCIKTKLRQHYGETVKPENIEKTY